MGDKIIKCLIYADDVILIAESRDQLQMMLNRVNEYCEEHDLKLNREKTKWMVFGQRGRPPKENIYIEKKTIVKVKEFKFLGVVFKANGSFTKHIQNRKIKSKSALGALWKVMKDREVKTETKLLIYNATIDKIMTYGSEVCGDEETEDWDVAERYFYKRLYSLPNNTPNYFIVTELDIDRTCRVRAMEKWVNYRTRIRNMHPKRLPKIIYNETEKNKSVNIQEYKKRNITLGMRSAKGLEGKVGSRMLYQTLEHRSGRGAIYKNMDCRNAGIVMKTRLELLNLGYVPYMSNEEHCRRCNEKVRDDIVHYLGKCQALEQERKLILGSEVIGIEKIRKMLNEHDYWNDIVKFVEGSTP